MDFLDPPGFLRHDLEAGDRHHLIFYTDRQIQLLHRQANPAFSQSQDLLYGRNVQMHLQSLETTVLNQWNCKVRTVVEADPVSVC